MTNSEKLKRIHDIVIDAAVEGQRRNPNKNYSSAEWLFKLGWGDAMVRIKDIVCDIIDSEE